MKHGKGERQSPLSVGPIMSFCQEGNYSTMSDKAIFEKTFEESMNKSGNFVVVGQWVLALLIPMRRLMLHEWLV